MYDLKLLAVEQFVELYRFPLRPPGRMEAEHQVALVHAGVGDELEVVRAAHGLERSWKSFSLFLILAQTDLILLPGFRHQNYITSCNIGKCAQSCK